MTDTVRTLDRKAVRMAEKLRGIADDLEAGRVTNAAVMAYGRDGEDDPAYAIRYYARTNSDAHLLIGLANHAIASIAKALEPV